MDRAGTRYWDVEWAGKPIPCPVDPTDGTLDTYSILRFHELFVRLFPGTPNGLRLLKIGCARSSWLPSFALRHGLDVTGHDSSSGGCEQARTILNRAVVDGRVVASPHIVAVAYGRPIGRSGEGRSSTGPASLPATAPASTT